MSARQQAAFRIPLGNILTLTGLLLIMVAAFLPWFQAIPDESNTLSPVTYSLWTLLVNSGVVLVSVIALIPLLGDAIVGLRLILGYASPRAFRWCIIWGAWAAFGIFVILVSAKVGLPLSDYPSTSVRLDYGGWVSLTGYIVVCVGAGLLTVQRRRIRQ